jgi:membrane protein required for colicin V production|nr:CvpA family protein [uncultured Macellibacteroides sp.]
MNWLDITLVCLAGLGFVKGLFDGFIKQVVSLIALILAIYFCGQLATWFQAFFLESGMLSSKASVIVSYILGFALIVAVINLAGSAVDKVVDATPIGVLNHLSGGAFGVLIMILFTSLFINFYETVDKHNLFISKETKEASRFYYFTESIIPSVYAPFHFFEEKDENKKSYSLRSI